jgi:DNA invertase Pin-like site-specific DNA recombinase
MVAAIYARKSTSQSDVADVEKSVSRQIALARAFASERKWPVIEEYIDDGVSGQESAKLTNRARMLADATAGKFEVVIVRDYDRISRDDREGPAFVYMLADAGVQVFEYTSRAPIKVERAMDRTMLNRRPASPRTRPRPRRAGLARRSSRRPRAAPSPTAASWATGRSVS